MALARQAQRVDPERLHFHRLADARRDHPALDARVHPRQLRAGDTAREEAVVGHPDGEPRAAGVAVEDGRRRPEEAVAHRGRGRRRLQELVDDDHVPERRVDCVVLGCFTMVGEAIGQHAFRYRRAPGQQDGLREGVPSAREGESAQRDERVATPVAEPRIAGDDGGAVGAPCEVRVGRAVERRPCRTPRGFLRVHARGDGGRLGVDAVVGAQHQHGFGGVEVEVKGARRRQVLDAIETALLFAGVEEIAIPVGFVRVRAVRERGDRRQRGIGPPGDVAARRARGEVEGGVLAHQRMEVAPRQQSRTRSFAPPAPAVRRQRSTTVRSRRATTQSWSIVVPSGSANRQQGHGTFENATRWSTPRGWITSGP